MEEPYDFPVAIRFLLSICFLFLVVAAILICYSTDRLSIGSNRFYFFCELIGIFTLSALLIRIPTLSTVLLYWGAIEISLACVTNIGFKFSFLDFTLFPNNTTFRSVQKHPFRFHPTLVGVPIENYASTSGIDVRHNSLGLRGPEIALTRGEILIAVFGGSSTYDVAVPNGSTWPEELERALGSRFRVANYGVPGYTSAENVIQTALLSNVVGAEPRCSLYYLGWNDIRNAHLRDLDGAYANFHLLTQFNSLGIRPTDRSFSPIYRALKPEDFVPRPPSYENMSAERGTDARLEEIYKRNVNTLISINRSRGTKTILVGQILNIAQLASETRYGWLPLVNDEDVWPLQVRFNKILSEQALGGDTRYIDADIGQFAEDDFVDQGHFSVSGAEKFARKLAPTVSVFCQ
jgi:lysophospholipase L1-like esterase